MILDIMNDMIINYHKTKYIDIKYHVIRYYIQKERIMINHILNSENIIDLFTKMLKSLKYQWLIKYIRMRNFHEILE